MSYNYPDIEFLNNFFIALSMLSPKAAKTQLKEIQLSPGLSSLKLHRQLKKKDVNIELPIIKSNFLWLAGAIEASGDIDKFIALFIKTSALENEAENSVNDLLKGLGFK